MFNLTLGWTGVAMTFGKPFAMAGAVYAVSYSPLAGSAAILIFALYDLMDGVLFRASSLAADRRLGQIRRVGDVIGDRIAIQCGAAAMVYFYQLPAVFYWAVMVRELILFSLVGYSFAVKRPLQEPNNPSRAAALCDCFIFISWLIFGYKTAFAFSLTMAVCGVLSFAGYIQTIKSTAKSNNFWQ